MQETEDSPLQSLEKARASGKYIDVTAWPQVQVDLRYGTKNNILQENIYGGFQQALLHPIAAEKFKLACAALACDLPGWKFLILDSLRPRSAQKRFWSMVSGTKMQPYFADPVKGSIHNYGFAIDLTLLDVEGRELDMGTSFDSLEELAEPRREREMLQTGRLTELQLQNRMRLRKTMEKAGYVQLELEWWHYDALVGSEVRGHYPILE